MKRVCRGLLAILAALMFHSPEGAIAQSRDDKTEFLMRFTYARRCNALGRGAEQSACITEMMGTRGPQFREQINKRSDREIDDLYTEYKQSAWPLGAAPTMAPSAKVPSISEIDAAARQSANGDISKERDMRAALCAYYRVC